MITRHKMFALLLVPVLLLATLLLAACGSPTRTSQASQFSVEQLNQTEALWKSKNINNYALTISYREQYFDKTEIYDLTIRNGQITNTSRFVTPNSDNWPPTPSPAQFYKGGFTIPELFAAAHTYANTLPSVNGAILNISYDPVYGYPNSLGVDNANVTDSGFSIQVTHFEVLK